MRPLLILALLFISCSKNSNSDQQPEQKDPLNLSAKLVGTWKMTAQTTNPAYDWNGDGIAETDMYAPLSSCQKNLGFTCNQDGTGLLDFNCSLKLPTKWQVTDNSKMFRFNFSTDGGNTYGADVKDTIIELTTSRLVVRNPNEPEIGKFYTITTTYTKQ